MTFGALTHSSGDLRPRTDNTYGLGTSSFRWTDVWAVDGTINTSDARLKQDIADAPLGLAFVKSLRPRVYRWRETHDTEAQATAAVDDEALAREAEPHEQEIRQIRADQLAGKIKDKAADKRVAGLRTKLNEIHARHTAEAREKYETRRPGRRLHYGLIAQEVKAALDAAGVDAMHAAFWKQAPSGEQSLAYSELTPILIAAIQEQDATIRQLSNRVAALEPTG